MYNYTYIYNLKIVISHGYVTNKKRLHMVGKVRRWDNLKAVPPPQFKNQHSAK